MDQSRLNKQKTLDTKKAIKTLAIIALIFVAIGCIGYFVQYNCVENNEDYSYVLTVSFPNVLSLISLLFYIAPYVLLVLYMHMFSHKKATIIVPIIFGSLAISVLFNLIINIINGILSGYFIMYISYNMEYLIVSILCAVLFGMAVFSALNGFRMKIFPIVAIVVDGALSIFDWFRSFAWLGLWWDQGRYITIFSDQFEYLGIIVLDIALLLFVLKNRIPAILYVRSKKADKTNPDQALRALKDDLDCGFISSEEYEARRAEIIKNL
ncbi:MAG: SHOCT domain-containing protein [Clostridia bacterium]|nr:SHOCT domain-containing protein [Clostridia bacterium]